jgi:hypothetical protein
MTQLDGAKIKVNN